MIRPVYIQSGGGCQRGAGIGNIFMSLFRKAAPYLKSAGKSLGKSLLKSGVGVAKDIIVDRKKVGETLRRRGQESAKELTEKLESKVKQMTGGRRRRRKVTKRRTTKRKAFSSALTSRRRGLVGSGKKRKRRTTVNSKRRKRRTKKDIFTSYTGRLY